MTFTDQQILDRTVENLKSNPKMLGLRVSREHYLWLAQQITDWIGRYRSMEGLVDDQAARANRAESAYRGAIIAVIDAAGGMVEGHPTSTINYLQRIRTMRAALGND